MRHQNVLRKGVLKIYIIRPYQISWKLVKCFKICNGQIWSSHTHPLPHGSIVRIKGKGAPFLIKHLTRTDAGNSAGTPSAQDGCSGQLELSTLVPPVSIGQQADIAPLPTRRQLRRQKSSSLLGIKPTFSDRLARSPLATRNKFLSYPTGFKEVYS